MIRKERVCICVAPFMTSAIRKHLTDNSLFFNCGHRYMVKQKLYVDALCLDCKWDWSIFTQSGTQKKVLE